MSPLDRIAQLTERAENAEKQADIALSNCEAAQREVALLRSQLADSRQQLERDSATIAKLAKDKQELVSTLNACHSTLSARGGPCWHEIKEARALASNTLSRHA